MGPWFSSGSTGGLQAQLAQAQSKLADCLHCATADTPEGKAQIQAWTLRVQNLESRIQDLQIAQRNQGKQAEALLAINASAASNPVSGGGSPPGLSPGLGGNLDLQG
jgi:hypothetical protein